MEKTFHGTTPAEQEAVRLLAVQAVLLGDTRSAVARRLGVTRQSLHSWLRKHRLYGPEGLVTRGGGRTERPLLGLDDEAALVGTITAMPPWRAGLGYRCWTRKAVAALVELRHGVRASHWKIDRMLRRWGFGGHKEVRRAFERRPAAVAARLTGAPGLETVVPPPVAALEECHAR